MKLIAAILTFLICFSHGWRQANAQAYFLFPNATEMKNLYPAAVEITNGLERFQTPTTWKSGTHRILARVIDFRDGKAFFEKNDGVVIGVEKSKLDFESQNELGKFETLLKARTEFVAKHKLEPQIVKLYADMKRAEDNVKLQEKFISDLRKEAARPAPPPAMPAEPKADQGRRDNGRARPVAREDFDDVRAMGGIRRKKAAETRLTARPMTNTIYIMKNASSSFRQDSFMPIHLDGGARPVAIGDDRHGIVHDPKFSSDDESILVTRADSDGHTNLIFLGEGEVALTASVSDRIKVTEVFKVVELEFTRGDSADDVVKSFGAPTHKESYSVEWPASMSVDSIKYVPTINQKTLSAEHWRFKDRPGLVVSIVNNRLYNVGVDSD